MNEIEELHKPLIFVLNNIIKTYLTEKIVRSFYYQYRESLLKNQKEDFEDFENYINYLNELAFSFISHNYTKQLLKYYNTNFLSFYVNGYFKEEFFKLYNNIHNEQEN